MNGKQILQTKKSFAVIGATQNKDRYGYEVFEILHSKGYQVFPVNPKYNEIDGIPCYPLLHDLEQKPDVVITALAPANTEQTLDSIKELNIETVWMPPECWNENVIQKCKKLKLQFIYDECPVGILKFMK